VAAAAKRVVAASRSRALAIPAPRPPPEMHRRTFLDTSARLLAASAIGVHLRPGVAGAQPGAFHGSIDRRSLVGRHDPVVRRVDPYATLSVGNGRFAFTADATGLQSFPDSYRELPLATQSEWGWHTFPNPEGYRLEDAVAEYDAHGRRVPYASLQTSAAGQWLRQSPHRLSLAQIGLALRRRDGSPARAGDLEEIDQRLDLWSGTLSSRFRVDGRPVTVWSRVHPERDLLAVRIEAPASGRDGLAVRIAFPYGSPAHTGGAADWEAPERHTTTATARSETGVTWARELGEDRYRARAAWSPGCELKRESEHVFLLAPPADGAPLELVVEFTPGPADAGLPTLDEVRRASERHWESFWGGGGAIDLQGSDDPRAPELERRIVLSQYLTALQCAGTLPPQETGLTFNSWHGKFHLEMHWWHAVHFALWGRTALLERSLPWYERILPRARATARGQGYRGARWPKMVGPDGRESPSTIGVFLIWQQPHPIYYAELLYRERPGRETLERMREVVFETAEFMASYPYWDAAAGRYVLGPPLIPAQEIHAATTTFDPTFELAYWEYGLRTAQLWRERLGLPRDPSWDHVIRHLAPLPTRDGLYTNAGSDLETFTDPDMRRDHPTLLGAYGFVPPQRVDRETMRRTLERVMADWHWEDTWGWDFPLTAMTAARLGEPETAIDALMMDSPRNRYLPNGHNYQRPELSIYLPGNGGLLAAVAMMAAGWDGAPETHSPGFPSRGWRVRWERLRPMP
jgi:protein-glucosylgalactosylhydroxylysine glucosidase